MKLLRKGPKTISLSITTMDRRLIDAVLSSFDQLPRSDGTLSISGELAEAEQELLHAALREQRAEQWKWFSDLAAAKGTWTRHGRNWKLTLPPDRMESLLQMLNDIRVSSWKILGCPAELPRGPFPPDTVNGVAGWLLLTTGYLQSHLLQALESPVPPKKARKKAEPSAKPPTKPATKKPKRPKKD